jgi:hypothetical protein
MKSDIFKLAVLNLILLVVLFCPSCKKDVELSKSLSQATNETTSLTTSTVSTINLVTTLAGVRNTPGYADGPALTAMFNGVSGIQLTSDGTLYIADKNNNAIRKLTAAGIVSTLPLKTTGDYPLQSPTSVWHQWFVYALYQVHRLIFKCRNYNLTAIAWISYRIQKLLRAHLSPLFFARAQICSVE